MSWRATSWAWSQRGLTPVQRCVLMCLADHHNKTTGLVCPSQETVADEIEVSVRTVREALVALEGAGLLRRRRRSPQAGRGRQPDQYLLTCDQPEDVAGWSCDDQPADDRTTNRQMTAETPEPSPIALTEPGNRTKVPTGPGAIAPSAAEMAIAEKVHQRLTAGKRSWDLQQIAGEVWDEHVDPRDVRAGARFLASYWRAATGELVPDTAWSMLGKLTRQYGKMALYGLSEALRKDLADPLAYAFAVARGATNGRTDVRR